MAAQETQDSHPASAQHAVFFNGFISVLRAGGLVDAGGRQEGRDKALVEAKQAKGDWLHKSPSFLIFARPMSCERASVTSRHPALGRPGRATSTTSQPWARV